MIKANEVKEIDIELFNNSGNSLFNTFSKCESFREKDLATLLSPIECTFDSSQIIFTSKLTFKYFLFIKSHFPVLFSINYPESFFQKIYDKKFHCIIGLEPNSKELTSFAIIDIKKNYKAEILSIAVLKEYQNKRIGTRLLSKVLEELVTFGVKSVKLVVNASNFFAFKLYKNAGFVEIDEDCNYYKGLNDSRGIIMVKTLVIERFWVFNIFRNIAKKFCV
jgi:ribosomal protein S18 acetylase RimI-like enzyme